MLHNSECYLAIVANPGVNRCDFFSFFCVNLFLDLTEKIFLFCPNHFQEITEKPASKNPVFKNLLG